jgi:hypothetical protein
VIVVPLASVMGGLTVTCGELPAQAEPVRRSDRSASQADSPGMVAPMWNHDRMAVRDPASIGTAEAGKIIASVAKHVLAPLGVRRKGRSRTCWMATAGGSASWSSSRPTGELAPT